MFNCEFMINESDLRVMSKVKVSVTLIVILDQVAINNILEEEPCSRSPIFTSCDESRSPEQQEDKRAERGGLSGLSKEALGAREGKRRGRKGG